jgi:methyl-accepting chemotaxis protein
MPTAEETSTQSDAVADAVHRLTELMLEIKDTLARIASAVEALATTGSG